MKTSRTSNVVFLVPAWLGACVSSGHSQETSSCAAHDLVQTEIVVNGAHLGAAPAQLQVKPGRQYEVIFRQPGYDDAKTLLLGEAETRWVILDVFSGVLGYALDQETHNWTFVEMVPEIAESPPPHDANSPDRPSG